MHGHHVLNIASFVLIGDFITIGAFWTFNMIVSVASFASFSPLLAVSVSSRC